MSAADRPQSRPVVQGDLSSTPFAHLVLSLQRQGLSGTLIVDRAGYETKVLFRHGRAVAARPCPRNAGLQEGLIELCALHQGAYAFWEGDLVGEGAGVTRGTVDSSLFVAESLRGPTRDTVISGVVDRYLHVRLRLLPEADLRRLGLRGLEARAAEQLRLQPMFGADFIERSDLVPAEARKLLYLLAITRQVVPLSGESSSGSGVRSAVIESTPAAAAHSGLPPRAAGSSLPPRASSAPSARPPAASAPPGTASGSRSPTPTPARRSSAAPPGASMPAWQQLAARRPGSLTPGSIPAAQVPTPSMAPPPVEALDAPGKFRRAEQLAGRRNFREAGRIADDLIACDSKNADYHALRAFIEYEQFKGDRPPPALLEAIERALRLDQEQPRALYVKGLVLKRTGKRLEAMRHFQKALEADPRHLEAERELRLARMRRDR